jgi:hypothetical protein
MPLTDPQTLRHLAEDHQRTRRADATRERLVHRAKAPRDGGDAPGRGRGLRPIVGTLAARLRWVTSLW